MIISFAWTTEALLSGMKTVTRRDWTDDYAKRFAAGMLVDAYNKLPRAGGRKVATIRITKDPYKQLLSDMPDAHFEREGGTLHWTNKSDYLRCMGQDREVWVIEFELLEVINEP